MSSDFNANENFETSDPLIEEEEERLGEEVSLLDKPFDPTQVNIDTKTPSLDTLIKRIAHDEIVLDTESYFQRAPNLWNATQQSRLIESILIRFPLPAFYFDGTNKNKWLVVDGLQRLSSIRNFVLDKEKPLRLTNLEFLQEFNGMTFDELDRDLQRMIEETMVVIYIINPGTPFDVKFNIFKRINTGGLILEPQEIRHALFQGAPAQFIAELGSLEEFNWATTYSLTRNKRMLDRDFANRFLCFYLLGYQNYVPDLDTFMSKAMAAIYKMDEQGKEKIKQDYIASLLLNRAVFGENAFRKIDPNPQIKRKPINKAVFDAFATQFALLTEEQRMMLEQRKEEVVSRYVKLLQAFGEFYWSVSSATGDRNKVNIRHSTVKELIQQVLNN